MSVQTLIQVRRGTASEWTSVDPTLSAGEWGLETDTGRYKIGNGLTAWTSLPYSSLLPKNTDITGASGIGVSFATTSGVPVTFSVTGIQSTQVNDFTSAVNSLITASAVSSSQVMDIVNSGLVEGNNIDLSYNTGTHLLTVAVTGLTIGTHVQAYDAGLASIASLTTAANTYIYTTSNDTYTTGIITSYGRSLVDDVDAATARTTLGLGTISTYNSGDFSLAGHTHTSSNITDFNSSVSGLLPTITGVSGIYVSSLSNNTYTVALSDPTIQSTDITDFNTAVSGLVSGIYAPLNSPALTGTPTVPTAAADTNTNQAASTAFVIGQASSSNPLMDGSVAVGSSLKYARADHVHPTDTTRAALAGATFTGAVTIPSGSGNFNYLNVANVPVSVSGHTHTSSNITDFNSSVSGLLGVKSLVEGSGIGITNNGGIQTIRVTGIPSSFITDLGNIATTEVVGRTGVKLTYDSISDTMYIDTTGVSFQGHTHTWSEITDASTKATLNELAYLSGVTAGTASASRAVVLDVNKDITGIGSITTTGNITVGGNLVVNGTTTTVNSTTVDIGDNIVRVNTSGLTTGGFEVYTGSDYKQLIWNVTNNRWEFTGGNIYTSGSFIGSLSGNASTVTNGVYTTDTGTVTSTMIANDTIVNADINSSAGIVYSKLNLTSGIVNTDISASAAIADTKLDTISTAGKVSNSATTATSSNTASAIVARDSSGNFTANVITASGFVGSGNLLTNLDANNISAGTLNVARLPTGIPVTNLASSGVTIGSTTVNLGQTTSVINGLSSISGTSAISPTTLYYCVIDGGSP